MTYKAIPTSFYENSQEFFCKRSCVRFLINKMTILHYLQDTGLWGIYFVTDAYSQEDMIFQISQEWMRLCNSVTEFEVRILSCRQLV